MTPATEPHLEYARRKGVALTEIAQWDQRSIHIGNARLAVFIFAAFMVYLFYDDRISGYLLFLPVFAFVGLMAWHARVEAARKRASRLATYYERGLARIADRWHDFGAKGERFADAKHPFARDLDLFGNASLFQLLNCARTRMGEETLANWLTVLSKPEVICARQIAVSELAGNLQLREDLAVLGDELHSGVHPARLRSWGAEPVVLRGGWQQLIAVLLAIVNVCGIGYWFTTGRIWPMGGALLVTSIFTFILRAHIMNILQAAGGVSGDLQLLASVLERLEREPFQSPYLIKLRLALETGGEAPSRAVARLAKLSQWIDSLANPVAQMLNWILLIAVHLAFGVEAWRHSYGRMIARWIDAVGEIEAVLSLAAYHYEHPLDPFAEIVEEPLCWEGTGLGHPLLHSTTMVRNSLNFSAGEPFTMISGSNMSGKSTFLRTVGINTVMALAGVPVRAQKLKLSVFTIGACIQTIDSLAEGRSRFYTEILRLKAIVELTRNGPPVLFLLDELLAGTNSHDRRIGAAGILCGLLDNGAIGLVTTHDLTLTQWDDPRIRNLHFEDHLEHGELKFDYRMRDGVVAKSNALELMRTIGLDV